jgi:RimJ/RimL family protein N-acetyltransferase
MPRAADTTFATQRLTIRQWDPDSAEDIAASFDIYRRDEVAKWLGAHPEPWASEAVAHQKLLRWQESGEEDDGFGLWAVVPDAVGHPVGTVLLVPLPDADGEDTSDIEIGWHLHPDHWGNGYATEAASRLLQYARETLGIAVVNSLAYQGNDASLGVMRRLGMVPRGETDEWYGVHLQWWSTP